MPTLVLILAILRNRVVKHTHTYSTKILVQLYFSEKI